MKEEDCTAGKTCLVDVFRFGLNKVFKLEFGSKVYLVISYVNTFVYMSVTREEEREGEEMQFSSVHI